jgi:tRNA C32,U32 (ribose-2'-O)-methylase TrmJ
MPAEQTPVFNTDRGLDKENMEYVDDRQEDHAEHVYEDEDDDDHHEKATEMQDHMQDLLKDLGMFRRKIGDDKSRFLQPLMERINR